MRKLLIDLDIEKEWLAMPRLADNYMFRALSFRMVGGALMQASTKSFPLEDLQTGNPGKSLQRKADHNVAVETLQRKSLSKVCRAGEISRA